MAEHVCPWWVGYFLVSPLRKIFESPNKILGPFVSPGMTVLEPGCGMGYFTLPLAEMAGPSGKVVAVDIQEKMLAKLRKRVAKAGLDSRIEARLAKGDSLGVGDLKGKVDLVTAIHVIHELPDQQNFFAQAYEALRPGGKLLALEPKGHVSKDDFARSIDFAKAAGFEDGGPLRPGGGFNAVFVKQQ